MQDPIECYRCFAICRQPSRGSNLHSVSTQEDSRRRPGNPILDENQGVIAVHGLDIIVGRCVWVLNNVRVLEWQP